jgi:hypothetical protein
MWANTSPSFPGPTSSPKCVGYRLVRSYTSIVSSWSICFASLRSISPSWLMANPNSKMIMTRPTTPMSESQNIFPPTNARLDLRFHPPCITHHTALKIDPQRFQHVVCHFSSTFRTLGYSGSRGGIFANNRKTQWRIASVADNVESRSREKVRALTWRSASHAQNADQLAVPMELKAR